ncbi:MAG: response regulator [Rhodohalobacter sp.]|uniref:response regulator n=1 Tax=Rhodohalobacter sp. TaxID=1974210 RepID=UPI0039762B32
MSQDGPTVLLIEDDPVISKLIEFKLKRNNYKFELRENGFSGFEAIKELKPDLVILDIMLPSVNGLEVLRKIREDKDLDNIRVIMLSASMKMKDKKLAFEQGVKDYIVKPFETDELIMRVKKSLEN